MKKISLVILIISLFVGCTKSPLDNVLSDKVLNLSGVVSVSGEQFNKAGYFNSLEESKVEKLCMLVFAKSDGELVKNISLSSLLSNSTSGNIDEKIENCEPGESYFIRLVANMDIPDIYSNYSEISALAVDNVSSGDNGVTKPLVMISDSIGFRYDSPEVKLGVIELKRKAARIVVNYDNIVHSIQYVKIEGTLERVSLFNNNINSTTDFTIDDHSVGLGGKIDQRTAYYYVYPKSGTSFRLTASINNIERTTSIYEGLVPNRSYSFAFSYNTPIDDYKFNPELTTYDPSISEFNIRSSGDVIELAIKENATIVTPPDATWISVSAQSKATSSYQIKVQNNITNQSRQVKIIVRDELNLSPDKELTITQREAKFMVVVVAGQSNALGFDESAVDVNGVHKTNPRTFQLSYRRGVVQPNLDVIPLEWSVDDMHLLTPLNVSGLAGAKGIHQPLAVQLLEKFAGTAYSDYDILVIPVSYGATSFLSGTAGSYDPTKLSPTVLGPYKWAKNSPYANTIVDRVKYIMDLNADNKLIGFAWCQGESDRTNYISHGSLFQEMVNDIFSRLNSGGYGSRVSKGMIDKDSWYVYTPPIYYLDYYLVTSVSHVYSNYKSWSPDTFVYIEPREEYTNKIGGNGNLSSSLTSHFGNDSYRTVVAPRVIEYMDRNGSLFNGKTPSRKAYCDATTPSMAVSEGGSLTDDDISEGLVVHLPFSSGVDSDIVGGSTIEANGGVQIDIAEGLADIYNNPRSINALKIDAPGKGVKISGLSDISSFTVSLMLKRTDNLNANIQRILSFVGNSNTSVLEYKSLTISSSRKPELMFEPVVTTTSNVVVAQFVDALTLRSETDWMHVVVTHDATTKTTSVYLNGILMNTRTLSSLNDVNFNQIILGESASINNGVRAQVANLMLWDKVLKLKAVRKLFLYNYYGFSK